MTLDHTPYPRRYALVTDDALTLVRRPARGVIRALLLMGLSLLAAGCDQATPDTGAGPAPEPCAAPPPADAQRCSTDGPGADLSGCDLRERSFRGANLVKTNLSYSDLTGVFMSEATMVRADLTCSTMVGARLFQANATEAILLRADLTGASLTKADLSGVIGCDWLSITPQLPDCRSRG